MNINAFFLARFPCKRKSSTKMIGGRNKSNQCTHRVLYIPFINKCHRLLTRIEDGEVFAVYQNQIATISATCARWKASSPSKSERKQIWWHISSKPFFIFCFNVKIFFLQEYFAKISSSSSSKNSSCSRHNARIARLVTNQNRLTRLTNDAGENRYKGVQNPMRRATYVNGKTSINKSILIWAGKYKLLFLTYNENSYKKQILYYSNTILTL